MCQNKPHEKTAKVVLVASQALSNVQFSYSYTNADAAELPRRHCFRVELLIKFLVEFKL